MKFHTRVWSGLLPLAPKGKVHVRKIRDQTLTWHGKRNVRQERISRWRAHLLLNVCALENKCSLSKVVKMRCLHPRVLISVIQLWTKVICDYEEDILELAVVVRVATVLILRHHPWPCCLAHPHGSSDG